MEVSETLRSVIGTEKIFKNSLAMYHDMKPEIGDFMQQSNFSYKNLGVQLLHSEILLYDLIIHRENICRKHLLL